MDKKYKENNGCAGICCKGCGRMDAPLNTFDWLADVPGNEEYTDIVEVQFKNTRKGYLGHEDLFCTVLLCILATSS